MRGAAAEKIPWIPFLPVSLIGAWFFVSEVMCVPYEVTVRDEHSISFRSILWEKVADPRDISSVRQGYFQRNYLTVRFQGSTVNLSMRMGDLDGFLTTLKNLNPHIQIKA